MTTNALSRLETDGKTEKRAQYEGFEFELEAPGILKVTNGSYGDEKEEHTYRVNVEDGVPTACECKSFEYRSGACKHMVAVAIREPVLDAGAARERVATDGGIVVADDSEVLEPNDVDPWEGPFPEYDKYGELTGERYHRCRDCGREALESIGRDDVGHREGCRFDKGA